MTAKELMLTHFDICINSYQKILDVLYEQRNLLERYRQLFSAEGSEKGIEISRDLTDDMVKITADIVKWERAIADAECLREQVEKM